MLDELVEVFDELDEYVPSLSLVSPGSIELTAVLNFISGSERIVYSTGVPTFILVTSPSAICILSFTLLRSAIFTIVGVVWLEFTVCPSSTCTETTMPSLGAVILVYPRFICAVFSSILV